MVEVTVPHIATKNKIRSNKLISPLHSLHNNPECDVVPQASSLSQAGRTTHPNHLNPNPVIQPKLLVPCQDRDDAVSGWLFRKPGKQRQEQKQIQGFFAP